LANYFNELTESTQQQAMSLSHSYHMRPERKSAEISNSVQLDTAASDYSSTSRSGENCNNRGPLPLPSPLPPLISTPIPFPPST